MTLWSSKGAQEFGYHGKLAIHQANISSVALLLRTPCWAVQLPLTFVLRDLKFRRHFHIAAERSHRMLNTKSDHSSSFFATTFFPTAQFARLSFEYIANDVNQRPATLIWLMQMFRQTKGCLPYCTHLRILIGHYRSFNSPIWTWTQLPEAVASWPLLETYDQQRLQSIHISVSQHINNSIPQCREEGKVCQLFMRPGYRPHKIVNLLDSVNHINCSKYPSPVVYFDGWCIWLGGLNSGEITWFQSEEQCRLWNSSLVKIVDDNNLQVLKDLVWREMLYARPKMVFIGLIFKVKFTTSIK